MTYLLDTNGVIALLVDTHEHHERAHRFFARRTFAIAPLVQLGVLQFLTRPRRIAGRVLEPLLKASEAWRCLRVLRHTRAKTFVSDSLDCAGKLPFDRVTGHRQWNDFYLVALAQAHGFMLATFDAAIAEHFPEVARLIP
jgi:uncharacterized protein